MIVQAPSPTVLPGGYHWLDWHPDTGCELAPACLSCPLPVCKEDIPNGAQVVRRQQRYQAMREAAVTEGLLPEQLVARFGVSERTVWRVLAETRRTA